MATEPGGPVLAQAGLGAQCAEAQADGVPCACLGVDCEECGQRRAASAAPRPPDPPRSHA
jgi:hypothetical protein